MPDSPLRVVLLTPGAGGMYCGSCMSDNMLARALVGLGSEVLLLPLYTPIRTDEPNVSSSQLFYGGVNVFLQEKVPLFRHLPRVLDRLLDSAWLIRMLAEGAVKTDVHELGALTLSMVRGEHGHQRKEVKRLVDWLARHSQPDVINLSNLLVAGCVPRLKSELKVPIVVTLQGDDVFLDELPELYREQVMDELRGLAREVDAFIVHSRFYAAKMSAYFEIPLEKLHVEPLGISLDEISQDTPIHPRHDPPTIGFLARICEAKGFHNLIDAFLALRQQPGTENARLRIAGWLSENDREYFDRQIERLLAHVNEDAFEHVGVLSGLEKLGFLKSIDVLCVPTKFEEPKGRYVLEALAHGVPVVQPEHGAFGELLESTGGGVLVPPQDARALARELAALLVDDARRRDLAAAGRKGVFARHSASDTARSTLHIYEKIIRDRRG